jgi:hypothetical protein
LVQEQVALLPLDHNTKRNDIMLSWIHKHVHTLIAVAAVTGTVFATVAANTTGLVPNSVGAWLTAIGAILLTTVGHIVVPPVVASLKRPK